MAPLFPHKFLGIGGEEDCNLYGREGISRVFLLLFGYDTCFSDVCSISNINSCLDMSGHQFPINSRICKSIREIRMHYFQRHEKMVTWRSIELPKNKKIYVFFSFKHVNSFKNVHRLKVRLR